jgi:hypothetical protein
MKISFKKKVPIKKAPVKKPNTTSVGGERTEKKYTPGGMYKVKNQYNSAGNLISSDTSRTLKGVLRGAPRKGKASSYKMGGSVKGKKK